eukprot:8375198-Pyramimonas_sp.AAC.1
MHAWTKDIGLRASDGGNCRIVDASGAILGIDSPPSGCSSSLSSSSRLLGRGRSGPGLSRACGRFCMGVIFTACTVRRPSMPQ